jgi:aldehyde:ferredoxin oxidoreductase
LEPYAGLVHDGPEYETGTMLGANLLITSMNGMQKAIYMADDLGLDIISVGNVIGFLMEAYEKELIDKKFLDGIDLTWGNVDAVLKMLSKIAFQEGVGKAAGKGVKFLAETIGKNSKKFAIHSKGHTFAAWNCHVSPGTGISYATANRGACHLNGRSVQGQNGTALTDSTGVCLFARRGYQKNLISDIMETISNREWTEEQYKLAGERVFNLEKCFNYREGFRKPDDSIPDRFFEEPLTIGPRKGAVLDRKEFEGIMNDYYQKRDWDIDTTRPTDQKLNALGLDFVLPTLDLAET